jgi:ATP-dependent DNA helicase RecQ
VAAQKLLSAVVRLRRERGQKFGAGQVIDILRGRTTSKVTQHGHHTLSVFGVGSDLGEGEWRGVVRQLLAMGLLAVEGDYGTLVTTPASDEVLYRGRTVRLRREPKRPVTTAEPRRARDAELAEADQPVFERLRAWRAAAAREQGVPAYVIFHDATLRQIASRRPSTLSELSSVSGVGDNKLTRYGEQVLRAIAA